jgi:hypothetical protein
MSGFADDYIQVNERIIAFRAKYPEGCLQSEIVDLTESRVTMRAYAYRTPDDPRPGIGHSTLAIPGSTPYTRGSELENCETSAWGRALAALGFEVKRAVASEEEVRSKAQPAAAPPAQPAATPAERAPHGGWLEGQVHAEGHKPLRARANGSLYCPTKLPNGAWCNWKHDAPTEPLPEPPAPDWEGLM